MFGAIPGDDFNMARKELAEIGRAVGLATRLVGSGSREVQDPEAQKSK